MLKTHQYHTPFINPSPDPRATGSVRTLGQLVEVYSKKKDKGVGKSKQKKKSQPAAAAGSADQTATDAHASPIKKDVPGPGVKPLDSLASTDSNPYFVSSVSSTGASDRPVLTGSGSSLITSTSTHRDSLSQQDPVLSDVDEDPSQDQSDKDSG